jgi:hypothetical protein
MPEPLSRRAALTAGLAGAAALALGVRPAVAAEGPDPGPALAALIGAEQDAAFVYRTAGPAGDAAPLAEQDEDHARALAGHLQAVGLEPPAPRRSRAGLPPEALAVLEAADGPARSRAAAAYERTLIAGCARGLAPLEEPGIVRTIATVMASHAQHLALHERAAGSGELSSER